jgi:hypothetical protein
MPRQEDKSAFLALSKHILGRMVGEIVAALDDIWEFVAQYAPDGKIKPWKARPEPASEGK